VRLRAPLLLVVLTAAGPARAADDFQLWTEVGFEAPLATRFRVAVHEEIRFAGRASRLELHNTDVGAAWAPSQRLVVSLGFQQEFARDGRRFRAESRPHAEATLRRSLGAAEIASRQRVEGRFRERRTPTFRYRSRLQLLLDRPLWPGGARPFVSEEIFVESHGPGLDQNRLLGGLAVDVRQVSASLYYALVSVDRGRWEHAHVLGVTVTYSPGGRPMMAGDG
jgi:hypothetical protein